jgi:hypothetical protein
LFSLIGHQKQWGEIQATALDNPSPAPAMGSQPAKAISSKPKPQLAAKATAEKTAAHFEDF